MSANPVNRSLAEVIKRAAFAIKKVGQVQVQSSGRHVFVVDDNPDEVYDWLEDDGDAFRLLLAVGGDLSCDGFKVRASRYGHPYSAQRYQKPEDKARAARLAILNLAASIGHSQVLRIRLRGKR